MQSFYLGKIERGMAEPHLGVFMKIAGALEVSPGILIGGARPELTPDAIAFGKTFDGAPAEVREKVLTLLRSICP